MLPFNINITFATKYKATSDLSPMLKAYKTFHIKACFILAVLSFAARTSCAQSFMEGKQNQLSLKEESAIRSNYPDLSTTAPTASQKQELKIVSGNAFAPLHDIESYSKEDSTYHIYLPSTYSVSSNMLGIKHLGLYATSSENSYVNLLTKRSAAFMLNYQDDIFCIKTGVIANQYGTRGITTQLGINGFLEYKISQQWSLAVYGTIYNHNPYFSMATFPFIETSSYGGWIKYEGGKMGMKLGARRYYDAFQKQWKMEPIITPSIKLGKALFLELPVGPLVQKSMEKLLKRHPNNSPIIAPNFN